MLHRRLPPWLLIIAAALPVPSAGSAAAGPLVLERFFEGPLVARGSVVNLRDGSKRDLTIAMTGRWDGPHGTLVEDVAYADGEKQHKVWSFERQAPGRYVGRRADVTKDAEVTEDAGGVTMTYKADTPIPAGVSLNLSFSDRFTLTAPDSVALRSDVTYFAVPVGTLTLTITKKTAK